MHFVSDKKYNGDDENYAAKATCSAGVVFSALVVEDYRSFVSIKILELHVCISIMLLY
jgi:hypothetical protein